jgi:hypothetical protein
VPRLIGQTAETQAKSSGSRAPKRQWDEASFFRDLEERKGGEAVRAARTILEWVRPRVTDIYWGQGSQDGSYRPFLVHKEIKQRLFCVYSYGRLEVYFYFLKQQAPFRSEEKRLELMERLNVIEGVSLTPADIGRRPPIQLSVLAKEEALQTLFETLEWVMDEIKAT